MMNNKPNKQGFIENWLVSGPVCTPYAAPDSIAVPGGDQLAYEKALRGAFYRNTATPPVANCHLGENSQLGEPWRYYYRNHSWFVDCSSFYGLLTRIEMDAATVITSETAQEVSAILWTYAAVELWLNGEKILDAEPPVYKPIKKIELTLPLQAGENLLYAHMQNLGIRDSRSLFGLQLPDAQGIAIALPHQEAVQPYYAADSWLESLHCENSQLLVPAAPPCEAYFTHNGSKVPVTAAGQYTVPENTTLITVNAVAQGTALTRTFELVENAHPVIPDYQEENPARAFYTRLAKTLNEPRSQNTFFSGYHVLARKAINKPLPEDEALLLNDLDIVESCADCADFLVIAMVRYLNNYTASARLQSRAREVLLNFRYWMDEPGNDGMCFWSENHALMFYGSQMAVGALYPDDIFTRSGRTGRQQHELGAQRCRNWLQDAEQHGVEEFNSASYFPVTMAALLNLVDFAPEDISKRAAALIDRLLQQLCLHVFKGSVISPQGRVYRDVIAPYCQSVQSILHLINPALPYSQTETMWCACFATSRYRFPEGLIALMQENADTTYTSGNARIHLQKAADYLLTSVASPRSSSDAPTWRNLCFDASPDKSGYAYVKSLNERYHGTNVFEPGVYGYQQHLWYAALSNECVVFTTHPGASMDMDSMRPGYWYGNGVFPAVQQKSNCLGAVYQIPASHPICFTHVFWPQAKFDATLQQGQWLAGSKNDGYIALWCSAPLVAENHVLSNCEYRCYTTNVAYFCVVGSKTEHNSLGSFLQHCESYTPTYTPAKGLLTAGDVHIQYQAYENITQVI